jgi:imidazolonepropionase-like amidohydrolase
LAGIASCGAASAQATTLVHCGTLMAIPGEATKSRATLVVRDGDVVEVREGFVTAAQYGVRNAEVLDLTEMFVMPGMIDCHVHLTGEMSPNARLRAVENSDADAAMDGVVFARRTLEAGFTTVRDVGASGSAIFALRDAINEGKVVGPRVLAAGEAITPTGGHGDGTHGYRDDLFDYPTPFVGVADGPYEARKAVRHQVKRGADVIKLTATGGVLSATAAGTDQQFFEDELEAIVDTAHSLGRNVAAHAHGADGIKAALRAGVDSIEHGSFLDDEAIELFRETGAYLVPTVFAGETVTMLAGREGYLVPSVREKALAVGPGMIDALGRAHRAGVNIAFGTDCGVGPHGQNARELELMVEAGMPPEAVLRSATVNAANLCGLGERVGTLERGKAADFIAVRGSPLEDISVLRSVTVVARNGVVVKDAR